MLIEKRSGRRLMNQINVVPYIDVMLVLLIIFMVAAPLPTVSGAPLFCKNATPGCVADWLAEPAALAQLPCIRQRFASGALFNWEFRHLDGREQRVIHRHVRDGRRDDDAGVRAGLHAAARGRRLDERRGDADPVAGEI